MSRFLVSAVIASAIFTVSACRRDPPSTQTHPWDESCGAQNPSAACLQLNFSASQHLLNEEEKSLTGSLHWALYQGGDVGILGPGDHDPLYSGDVDAVDLAGGEYSTYIPGAPGGMYQSLAYIDHDASGDSGSGDAVTFLSDPFPIVAGEMTRVEVVLDYVR